MMNILRRHLAAFCLATMALTPAATVAGGLDGLVRVEVLDGGLASSGRHVAALRLTLAEGWKTYWRTPGDAGIPPQFDWRASRNLGEVTISWPTPIVFNQNGLQSIGYKDQLVLPIEVTPARPGQPVRLTGELDIGLCNDVCIPGSLSFDQQLDPDAPRHPAIAAALAQRPYSRTEAGVRAATCDLTPIKDGLRLTARVTMPSAGGREVTVIEPGNPALWASQASTSRKGDLLIAQSDLTGTSGQAFALDRSAVRITVLGERRAVDILGCTPG